MSENNKLSNFIEQLYKGLLELQEIYFNDVYDVHVDNIKVDKNGNVKIIDF
jgi:CRISPR/Cas system endoribonuclease Cas6 (RAMP superfamily)